MIGCAPASADSSDAVPDAHNVTSNAPSSAPAPSSGACTTSTAASAANPRAHVRSAVPSADERSSRTSSACSSRRRRATASSIGGRSLRTSLRRLPGRSARAFVPLRDSSRRRSTRGRGAIASAGWPTYVASTPAVRQRASSNGRITAIASMRGGSVRSRLGRQAHTCGATYQSTFVPSSRRRGAR